MIRFFLSLLLLTIMIGGIVVLAADASYWAKPSFFLETLVLLAFTTGLLYTYLNKASAELFVQMYLMTIAIKLLGFGAYIFVVVWLDQPRAFGNIVFFMITYFAFTALEIGFLYHKKTRS